MSFGHALYYPYIHIQSEEWLKQAYLFWDKISRIVPASVTPDDERLVRNFNDKTRFIENIDPRQGGILYKTAEDLSQCIDKNIEYFDQLKSSKTRLGDVSYIHSDKMNDSVVKLIQKNIRHPKINGWITVDKEIGDIYMKLLAANIAEEFSVPYVTDTMIHPNDFSTSLHRTPSLFQEELISRVGSLMINVVLPDNMHNISYDELILFKEKYSAERYAYFDEINKLSEHIQTIDNESALQDAIHHYSRSLARQTGELKKQYELNGIITIRGTINIGTPAYIESLMNFIPEQFKLLAYATGLMYGVITHLTNRHEKVLEIRKQPLSYLLNINAELTEHGVIDRAGNLIYGMRK